MAVADVCTHLEAEVVIVEVAVIADLIVKTLRVLQSSRTPRVSQPLFATMPVGAQAAQVKAQGCPGSLREQMKSDAKLSYLHDNLVHVLSDQRSGLAVLGVLVAVHGLDAAGKDGKHTDLRTGSEMAVPPRFQARGHGETLCQASRA